MDEFLAKLLGELKKICPTFLHVPPQTPYPYITIEAENVLQGLPAGPSIAMVIVKIWSRYPGVKEILQFTRAVEECLSLQSFETSMKISNCTLVLLDDGQTRVLSFRLKARIPGGIQ